MSSIKKKIGHTFGEYSSMAFAKRQELWGPIITTGSLVLLYAPRGLGKTFISLKIAHSIATGSKFLKWHGCGNKKIIVFDGEMGHDAMSKRLWNVDDGAPISMVGGAMRIVNYADCGGQLWNISDPEDQKKYNDQIEDHDVVLIDNLLTASYARDRFDDETKQWARTQAWLVRLRDAGKAVVLIHHAGKSGGQLGTSQRENVMDNIIALKPAASDGNDRICTKFDLVFEKTRHFSGSDAEGLRVEMFRDDAGIGNWNWTRMSEEKVRIVQRMRANKCTMRQIAQDLGMDLMSVIDICESLEKKESRGTEEEDCF